MAVVVLFALTKGCRTLQTSAFFLTINEVSLPHPSMFYVPKLRTSRDYSEPRSSLLAVLKQHRFNFNFQLYFAFSLFLHNYFYNTLIYNHLL